MEFSEFIAQQMEKNKEMVDSVRVHHGEDMADRLVVWLNMVSHEMQMQLALMNTVLSLRQVIGATQQREVLASLADLALQGRKSVIETFEMLFTDDQRKVIGPFADSAHHNMGQIMRTSLESMRTEL